MKEPPVLWKVAEDETNNKQHYWVAALLAVITLVCHLIFGVWFWTKSPTNAPKVSIGLSGKEYLATYAQSGWGTKYEMDGALYNRGAIEILNTGLPRTYSGELHLHAPVYPYFLAACYGVGGIRLLSLAIPQAFLSGLTTFLLALAAYRLTPTRKMFALLGTGLLILCNIHVAKAIGYPMPTNLILCLFAGAVWLASGKLNTMCTCIGFALLLGLGVYTQAAFFTVAVSGGIWLMLRSWQERTARYLAGAGLLLLLGFSKVLLSQIFTDDHSDDYVRLQARGILWQANNPCYENLQWWDLWQLRLAPNPKLPISEQQVERFHDYLQQADGDWQRAAMNWIRENPAQYAKLCFIRFRTDMGPFSGDMKRINRILSTVFWLLTFPAGLVALWKWRDQPFSQMACLMMVAILALDTFVLAEVQFRYRLPMDLLLAVYAGIAYAGLWGCLLKIKAGIP